MRKRESAEKLLRPMEQQDYWEVQRSRTREWLSKAVLFITAEVVFMPASAEIPGVRLVDFSSRAICSCLRSPRGRFQPARQPRPSYRTNGQAADPKVEPSKPWYPHPPNANPPVTVYLHASP
jgi:hypothetical protein